MTIDKRLEAIEARVWALGWLWGNFHEALYDLTLASTVSPYLASGDRNPEFTEKFYEIAERLLACYEPGATLEINHYMSAAGTMRVEAILDMVTAKTVMRGGNLDAYPPEGHYKLMPVGDVVAYVDASGNEIFEHEPGKLFQTLAQLPLEKRHKIMVDLFGESDATPEPLNHWRERRPWPVRLWWRVRNWLRGCPKS